jgi:hypothetical protein
MRPYNSLILLVCVVFLVIIVFAVFLHGAVYSLLQTRAGHGAAILGTSVLYVSLLWPIPFEGWILVGATAATGLVLGVSRWLSGSVLPAILAHIVGVAKILSMWLPLMF